MAQFNFGDERIIYTIANTNAVIFTDNLVFYRERGHCVAIGHTEDTTEDYQNNLSLDVTPFIPDEIENIHKTLTKQDIIKSGDEMPWVSFTKGKTNIKKYTPT